jgi:hypothetical protein
MCFLKSVRGVGTPKSRRKDIREELQIKNITDISLVVVKSSVSIHTDRQ